MGLEFKRIKNFNNYGVNKLGQIYSYKSLKLLKPIKHTNGYWYVNLYNDNTIKVKSIHSIVMETFICSRENSCVINHKNLDKSDNRLENLEYITQKENIKHSAINGRQIRAKGNKNKYHKPVLQYDLNGNLIKEWDSVMDAERGTGIRSNYISNCALGKCKKSQGFIWQYKKHVSM